ncbi:hypothetical protein MKX03_033472 [Papaver bracteatum]|nr:hypothetical protein MKX03_033472 [Papaver bracteatum]
MTCNHEIIPANAPVSITRVKYLAYCNLRKEVKGTFSSDQQAEVQRNIEHGLPIDDALLFTEMPPGYEEAYAQRMEAKYNWKRGIGHFEAA